MMRFWGLITASSTFHLTSAHYVFNHLIANGTINDPWKYVRHVSPNGSEALGPHTYPHYDLSSPNIRCGRDAMTSGTRTDIATIIAGDEVGFRIDLWNAPMVMFHDGPRLAYLSRSPEQTRDGLKQYEGDGDWFKIAQIGPYNQTRWFQNYNTRVSEFNFTIPATTPAGLYLLRADSVYPHEEFNRTQFYMNCAQIEVVGNGNPQNELGPLVRFPGAYDDFDRGIWIPAEIAHYTNLDKYQMPGPGLWQG